YLAPSEPGGSRFNELARFWVEAGHNVTVVCGNLGYATGQRVQGTEGRWHTNQIDGAVSVWRCHVPASYNSGYAGRAWAFVGFLLSAMMVLPRVRRPDIVIATSPPLTIAITGWLASRARRRRVPWVFEVRDLWPESAITTGVLPARGIVTR